MNRILQLTLFIILTALLSIGAALAEDSLAQRLQFFKQNPRKAMSRIPKKEMVSGEKATSPFTAKQVKSRSFVKAKDKVRMEILRIKKADKIAKKEKFMGAPISPNDRPGEADLAEYLVDDGDKLIRSLETMDEKNLKEGKVENQPWSDYYWALVYGLIAFRYSDEKYLAQAGWENKEIYETSEEGKKVDPKMLSPAEKYDLLIGDSNQRITKKSWAAVHWEQDTNKTVEGWMGICHGWSPASFMLKRPTASIDVMAADGKTMVHFYPSDLKALGSYLWAKNQGKVKVIGGRCAKASPAVDGAGRIQDQDCFDTNPGTWHQAVVNQIGVKKKSFVMDVTYDAQVWNQPLQAYSYVYFNPETMTPVNTLKEALVDIKDFKSDYFPNYRAKNAKYVVGISMQLDYMVENMPKPDPIDNPSFDRISRVNYQYDLELDENMNILGGEWYQNAHPDFLWTPGSLRARTMGDIYLDQNTAAPKSWDGKTPLPAEWLKWANEASATGSPLARIVEALIDLSRAVPDPMAHP